MASNMDMPDHDRRVAELTLCDGCQGTPIRTIVATGFVKPAVNFIRGSATSGGKNDLEKPKKVDFA